MSKFNKPSEGTKTTNVAGGKAYKQSPEMELVSLLLTSFANEQFYRSSNDTFGRLKELLAVCNPKFAAQAAVYARTKFNMRSISHVAASELAKHISGEQWAKDFYAAVVNRPDDMMEILSYYKANNNTKSTLVLPGSMKKGFALAFDKFDGYQLAKWRGEGKDFKLVDIVNLVRPVPSEQNAGAIQSLIKDELVNTNTWEAKLSKAGQDAEDDDEQAHDAADRDQEGFLACVHAPPFRYRAGSREPSSDGRASGLVRLRSILRRGVGISSTLERNSYPKRSAPGVIGSGFTS